MPVKEGHGLTLLREGSTLDDALTTRPIMGANWTVDTAVVFYKQRHLKTVPALIRRFKKLLNEEGGRKAEVKYIQLDLLRFVNDRVRGVACHDPTSGACHDRLILEPEESEVVDTLRKVRLDYDVSRNHSAWNVRVVGAVVAVRLRLRDGAYSSYV